jgi:hypothetical protein
VTWPSTLHPCELENYGQRSKHRKKIGGGFSTGTARKIEKNQRSKETETPHLRSTIKLKSKEGNNTHG